jgi:DNA polymerase-1
VCTLLGRQRHLPDALSSNGAAKAHALRAAINTPIQGGAADIAMLAMLELRRNERLKELGWRLLMQVHDEVILEGDSSSADEALAVVRHAMQNPFVGRNLLLCALDVSANHADNWYNAK